MNWCNLRNASMQCRLGIMIRTAPMTTKTQALAWCSSTAAIQNEKWQYVLSEKFERIEGYLQLVLGSEMIGTRKPAR